MIPLSVPTFKGNEWNYVKDCLDTEWVSSAGTYVNQFETHMCAYTGARHAVACVNGTAALQVALQVVGVHPGDEVLVPTLTFISTVNAVKYLGCEPVFMDCDEYYNIDAEKTLEFIEQETVFKNGNSYSKKSGRKLSAIVPVHIFGNAARLQDLLTTCRARNIKIVEDAAESLGTVYISGDLKGRHTGTVGDIGCFSFNGNKIITTGGGGMIVTDVSAYAEKARYLTTQAKDDELRYIHNEVGYNFRLTNIQAALGVAQLEVLPEYLRLKRSHYLAYKEKIDGIEGLILAESPLYAQNNHWMYPLQIEGGLYGKDREELMEYLKTEGIQTRPVWYLNHLQAPYRDCRSYHIQQALHLLEVTLCIPCSVSLKTSDIDFVLDKLHHA
jgi:aminotransferase in exopolysaccharide biosynthesis